MQKILLAIITLLVGSSCIADQLQRITDAQLEVEQAFQEYNRVHSDLVATNQDRIAAEENLEAKLENVATVSADAFEVAKERIEGTASAAGDITDALLTPGGLLTLLGGVGASIFGSASVVNRQRDKKYVQAAPLNTAPQGRQQFPNTTG